MIGEVLLQLGLVDKNFKTGLDRATDKVKKSVDNMKNLIVAAKLGSYLMTGADDAINSAVGQMRAKLNLMNEGLNEMQYDQIAAMAEQFELLGTNAETAQLKMTEFVLQGKATGLKELGIYLDQETLAMMKNADQAERLQFVMSKFPEYIQGMQDMLPDNIENMLKMRKTMDDLKKSMGSAFLSVIQKITDAFGGMVPAMKTAIIAFTAYKTAMILGNVGIGISKAIAQGGAFAAPVAIAMGAAALASIGALIGGAALAVSALNGIEEPSSTKTSSSQQQEAPKVEIQINRDKYGETAEIIQHSSGGGSSSVQTNYGTK